MPARSPSEPPLAAAFLETARAIGNRLVATAVWNHDRCNWTGDEIEPVAGTWQVVHRSVDGGLYSGSAGIGRFLAYLWAVAGGTPYRSTALAALRRSLDTAAQSPSPALWHGSAGIACAALEVGGLLREPALATDGVALARRVATRDVPEALTQDAAALDMVSGLSGTLTGLVYVARRVDDTNISEACDALVNRLLTAARKQPGGWSWPMHESEAAGAELCGLAHGASGVVLALMETHALAPNPALPAAAWRGIDYENCWFHPGQSNWPDLRTHASTPQTPGGQTAGYSWFWCHGAAGIALTRLRLYQLTANPRALADAGAALHAVERVVRPIVTSGTLPSGPEPWNFSVCHGFGSALEAVLYAHRMTRQAEYMRAASALAVAGMRAVARENGVWRCGVPGGGEHPGAMLGLAGIGMEYLALADLRVPPVTLWV